jgi:glycosyltransferase involved in cell wall biosynthesis
LKISIITVCYNSGKTLESTIQSVIAQDFPNIEYIVIDGASIDNTEAIIAKYRGQIAHYISEPDQGIYDAMNKGLALCTGDVVGILNSDDVYKNTAVLSTIATHFTNDIDCLSTDVEIFSENPQNVVRYYSCTQWRPWMFRIGHQPPHPGFFVRNTCYQQYGFFDIQFKLAADFEILLRLIGKYKCRTKYLSVVTVSMRSGGASQKNIKNIIRANKEDHRALRKNGYFSLYPFIWLKYIIKIFQYR